MVHTCNLSIFEVEAKGSLESSRPGSWFTVAKQAQGLECRSPGHTNMEPGIGGARKTDKSRCLGFTSPMLVLGSLRGPVPQNKLESRGHQTLVDTHKDLGTQKEFKDSLGCYTVLQLICTI